MVGKWDKSSLNRPHADEKKIKNTWVGDRFVLQNAALSISHKQV
jgi:hypothetical protein